MSAVEVRSLYRSMEQRLARARKAFGRPLSLSEKILVSHCWDFERQTWDRGKAILKLRVDRVAMQDVTGQRSEERRVGKEGRTKRAVRRVRIKEQIKRELQCGI